MHGCGALIRQTLIDLAAQGAAILVITQDLDEAFELGDRIAVMREAELFPRCWRAPTTDRSHRPADDRTAARSHGGRMRLALVPRRDVSSLCVHR